MEAASVAWHPLGWTPVGFSEIEPFPCAILKHRFPNTPNYGSLTEYQSWPLEPGAIDLLVGGTPCQSFSVAGLRKGLTDPRGNLALTFLGLADKLKPRWIVWENVPGVLSSNGGRDFGSFVGALGQLGYGWAMRILDAQHFGVPQRRRRVFVVACLGDWRAAAEVLSLREGLRGYLETGNKKRKGVAADAGASVEAGCWWDGGQVSQTLDAVLAKGQTMPEKNRFPAVLQPKPVVIDRAAFNQGENAQYEPHIGESEVMDSLVARGPHAVAFDTYNQTTSNTSQAVRSAASDVDHVGAVFSPTMAVRRLTPNECYRLQGFPDNWGRIPWKGKPAEECPDGPQYKAAGNSMAVPVMRWIGERIAAVDSTLSHNA
jgi:DNA (cytosine-5)-methyltransferase 1